MKICDCSLTLRNTGVEICPTLMRDAEMLILVPKYGSTGALNKITLSDTLNQAYFDGKVANANVLDRWYPLPKLKNPSSERGEPVYVEYDDNERFFVRQGARPFSFLLPNQEPVLLGKLEQWRCQEFGVYIIDKNKSLIGMLTTAGELRPIEVDQNSWTPNYIFPKASDVPTISVSFNFNDDEQDADLKQILASEISPVNLTNLKGLRDVDATYSGISTTSFKAALATQYGSAKNPKIVKGLLITDFALYNTTNSSAVTISTMTESPDGTYTFTFAIQTVGHKLRLTPTKTGYDFANVVASLVTIV